MTDLHTRDVLEQGYTKEQALDFHLSTRFYPPLADGHRQAIKESFALYWNGELTLDKLAEGCYLRDIDGLGILYCITQGLLRCYY